MCSDYQDQLTVDVLKEVSVSKAIGVIIAVSVLAFILLIWLIYFKGGSDTYAEWVSSLPAVNAFFNSASTVLLLLGFRAVKQRKFATHMRYMLSAFVTSSLFLISYVIYHNFHGDTPFQGEGLVRPVYFFILISHIILSAFVVPLILTSFYFAFSGKFITHRKVSRFTFPVWLYVSVTGVVIFFMLKIFNP